MDKNNMLLHSSMEINKVIEIIPESINYRGVTFVQKMIYDSLLNEYSTLKQENNTLKGKYEELEKKFFEACTNYEQTKLLVSKLSEEISLLKEENAKLKAELKIRDNQINELKDTVNLLLKDKRERDDMMFTAELITLYQNMVTEDIYGSNEFVLFKDLIIDTQLTKEQQIKYNTYINYYKNYNWTMKQVNSYLSQLKNDRNYESHARYQPDTMSIRELELCTIRFISSLPLKRQNDYKFIIGSVIKQLKDKYGDYPFKHLYN